LIFDLLVGNVTLITPLKKQLIFCSVLATVHLLTNFEMSSIMHIGPFWWTDPRTDGQTDRTTDKPTSVAPENSTRAPVVTGRIIT